MTPDPNLCPEHLRESLDAYAAGRPTGSFLRAVLEHDLFEALGRADAANLELLPHIVAYVYHHLPNASHGSAEAVRKWLEAKAKERREAREAPKRAPVDGYVSPIDGKAHAIQYENPGDGVVSSWCGRIEKLAAVQKIGTFAVAPGRPLCRGCVTEIERHLHALTELGKVK